MSQAIAAIHQALAEFDETPDGYATALRHDFERLIVESLERLGWTQRQLAEKLGKPESFVSRLIHGKSNCELQTIGTVMHALGVRPTIVCKQDTKRRDDEYGQEITDTYPFQPRYAGKAGFTAASRSWTGPRTAYRAFRQPKRERPDGRPASDYVFLPATAGVA